MKTTLKMIVAALVLALTTPAFADDDQPAIDVQVTIPANPAPAQDAPQAPTTASPEQTEQEARIREGRKEDKAVERAEKNYIRTIGNVSDDLQSRKDMAAAKERLDAARAAQAAANAEGR